MIRKNIENSRENLVLGEINRKEKVNLTSEERTGVINQTLQNLAREGDGKKVSSMVISEEKRRLEENYRKKAVSWKLVNTEKAIQRGSEKKE